MLQGPGRHNSRHRTSKAQQHGDKGFARQAQMTHDVFHHIGHAGHIAAVFQKAQGQEQNQDIGQERDDGSHATQSPIYNQGLHALIDVPGGQSSFQPVTEDTDGLFQIALQPVPYCKRQEEHHGHNQQEYRDTPDPVGKNFVQIVSELITFLFVQKHFPDDFFNKVVFFPDDFRFVILIQQVILPDRIFFLYFLVFFQQLQSVPTEIL